ncbi:MAG TPA: DNA alkylation repair protein [Candidatus Acidoferrum sp.]|nr:DNA alkylation repair protein [Candidatus Acidoferrum sp.]
MKGRSRFSSIPTRRFRQKSSAKSGRWTCAVVLRELRKLGTKRNVDGMAGFGIVAKNVYGVSKPKMDELARRIGRNHALAVKLWTTSVHDARILAGMIDDPTRVTGKQMESWVRDFDNWDICDGTCCHLFVFAKPAWEKAIRWTSRKAEFEKRAGFALIAYLAYRDKAAPDAKFKRVLSLLARQAWDERNFVRKAVNWALRNIGKRNKTLNGAAIRAAEEIHEQDSRPARWIASDALRELRSSAVQKRLRKKAA